MATLTGLLLRKSKRSKPHPRKQDMARFGCLAPRRMQNNAALLQTSDGCNREESIAAYFARLTVHAGTRGRARRQSGSTTWRR